MTEPRPAAPVQGAARPDRLHRWRRRLLRAGIVVLVLAIVVPAGIYAWLAYYYGKIEKVALPACELQRCTASPSPGATAFSGENFLLVGSDTRQGVGNGFGHPTDITGQRSDTVILAHLPPSGKPTLVSFPRDSYVEIPPYTDAQGVRHPAHMDKLNTAFSLGGYSLLIRTIEQLTQLRVDHYVEVNFLGFEKMVDAIGGVTLCARTTRNDPANGPEGGSNDFMTAGVHPNVSGKVALAFVRDRHSFVNQDISRILDQQYFLKQMIAKVESIGVLLNPVRLNNLLGAVAGSLRIDRTLSMDGIRTLLLRLRNIDPAHVHFVTLPFTTSNGTALIDGVQASVVLPDPKRDAALFERLRTDAQTTPGGGGGGGHHRKKQDLGLLNGADLTCGA